MGEETGETGGISRCEEAGRSDTCEEAEGGSHGAMNVGMLGMGWDGVVPSKDDTNGVEKRRWRFGGILEVRSAALWGHQGVFTPLCAAVIFQTVVVLATFNSALGPPTNIYITSVGL